MSDGLFFFLQLVASGIAVGSLYALAALGFVLIYKATDILNFAHGEAMLIGALVCYTLIMLGVPFLWAVIITGGLALLFGMLTERLVLRPLVGEGQFSTVMITIGLSIFLRSLAGIVFGHDNKVFPSPFSKAPISFEGIVLSETHLWAIGVSALMVILFFLFFRYSRLGLSMRGVANDLDTAMLMGISVKRVFAMTWGLSFVIAALAGIFLANVMVLNIGLALVAIKAFPAVILGGMESIPGAIIGGIVIGILETLVGGYLDQTFPGVRDLTAFVVLFIVLMVRPYGLFGKEEIERV
ncbi:branched-chain amino acid ABC transporter permease [Desulfomonile tiedjei]|uniref:Amino acid/amide ABC transporter membrane protein 1, HAAT family n=1 Tax=Desulfomonile tiedjei (strain ATCC 49306 / DSM 6799 / DCB-1) TaxID=706587 RepID=I4C3D6_DESTA|nr:branched-chain amino acid ABC transporter permease [Desulfomonile tiedjei]AFM24077.1 amino acid/amide ABC transporter membrane protein 1, HAAT family [Desulfomonile tiedjei DSM 6799]